MALAVGDVGLMARAIPYARHRLARTVKDRGGATLRTRDDAQRYVLRQLKARPGYRSWECAAELLLEGGDTETLTEQIEYALLLEGALDVAHTANAKKQPPDREARGR